jgi:tRNA-2-methylthio-N6-dimethylallyladenosine synthase
MTTLNLHTSSPLVDLKDSSSAVDLPQKGVYISTYGCQMNESDSERMYSLLEMTNYTPVSSPDQADLIIINSCSVREKPVHKVHSEVGTYRKLKEKNPRLKIGVGGCVGSQEKEQLLKVSPLIDFVFGTDNIDMLPGLIQRSYEQGRVWETQFQHRAPYHIETLIRNTGVTAFVNITKGCDNFCTFCVVPYTRGREKSRPLKHILEDIKKLVDRGVKEVTVLGQNVNSYESDCGADFADLLKALVLQTDIQRIRFTTSHPKDFNEKLMDVMAEYGSRICEYIHLPVQSGSSEVLKAMNRGYSRQEYLDRVALIKEKIPSVVLSTDIIVGFPGETEEDFQETLSLMKEVQYETLFAFKYSPRPFTKAARYENQIEESVKDERLQRLFAHFDSFSFPLAARYENQILEVLVEGYDEKRSNWHGRSTQNKNIYFTSGDFYDNSQNQESLVGLTVQVKISKAFPTVLRGVLVGMNG